MKKKIKYIINGLIRRGYWFNNVFFQDYRKFRMYNTFNTDVINLGSTSGVAAFNYDGLNIKGANWAMSRNPLIGDYAILRNYSSFLKKNGSTVIISLCPFTAFSGSYDYLDDRYYKVLYPSTIPYYSYIHDVQVSAKWENPMMHYPIFALFTDLVRLVFPPKSKQLSDEELQRDADTKFKNWCHEFSISSFDNSLSLKNTDSIEDAIVLLNQITQFCKSHGCIPVFVLPPIYSSLTAKFTPSIRTVLFDKLVKRPEFQDIRFLNYIDDPNFMYDRSLFKDSYLLNEKGAKKFTKHLLSDLGII